MPDPNFLILYVRDPAASVAFYAALLDKQPVESAPTFAMFALANGTMLGLWASSEVEPSATPPGGMELALTVADADAVRATHAAWRERGLPILQAPTEMDFGHTFVAQDPDGHRLRVFAPADR